MRVGDVARLDPGAVRQTCIAALIGAGVWGFFFAFVLFVHAAGLLVFPQLPAVSAVFVSAVCVNIVLAVTSRLWIGWPGAVYAYEALNAILVTALLAYMGGSAELGTVFFAYGFFVIHTGMIRPEPSPFVIASICGLAYASLAVAEACQWVTLTPVLHHPLRAGERLVIALFGFLALNSLAFYARRYAAERRQQAERLGVLVVERTRALGNANAELVAKARALQASKQELEDFVYTVTHDLKTPVSNVLLLADLLLDGQYAIGAEVRSRLERIRDRSSVAENMITDLWRFLEITSQPELPTSTELSDLVAKTLEDLQPQIEAKGVRVAASSLPPVWGRPTKLTHVMANLLSNAVKYTPDCGGLIEVSAHAEPGSTLISVRDNGVGIPEDYHQRIFELFGQAPDVHAPRAEDRRGTGVGLAIVKRIVEEHGGQVWVESSPGAGSRFSLRLPQPEGGLRSERLSVEPL